MRPLPELWARRDVDIHRGADLGKILQVTCPDCGHGGGSSYPCYCDRCARHLDADVMMLPSCNGRIISNWVEALRDVQA